MGVRYSNPHLVVKIKFLFPDKEITLKKDFNRRGNIFQQLQSENALIEVPDVLRSVGSWNRGDPDVVEGISKIAPTGATHYKILRVEDSQTTVWRNIKTGRADIFA